MTKFILSMLALCLLFSFATADSIRNYARCEFPDTENGNGVIMLHQTGNNMIGRSKFSVKGGVNLIKVEFIKRPLKRGNCDRLSRYRGFTYTIANFFTNDDGSVSEMDWELRSPDDEFKPAHQATTDANVKKTGYWKLQDMVRRSLLIRLSNGESICCQITNDVRSGNQRKFNDMHE